MRLTRIALPLLLCSVLSACAAGAGAGAEPSATTAPQAAGVQLLNRAEALRLMSRNYPALLRDAQVTGDVVVRVTLNAQGGVAERTLARSTHQLFGAAALTVADQLLFTPPAAAGERVNVRMQFTLDQRADISIVR